MLVDPGELGFALLWEIIKRVPGRLEVMMLIS